MKRVKLTQGKYALVDDEDFDILSNNWKWRVINGYAVAALYFDGKRVGDMQMHRFLMDTPAFMDTDHINRNKLDNRKSNLRIVTRSQNSFNSPAPRNNKSGIKGVFWHKQAKKWWAYININGNRQSLGMFTSKPEAIKVRVQAEKCV